MRSADAWRCGLAAIAALGAAGSYAQLRPEVRLGDLPAPVAAPVVAPTPISLSASASLSLQQAATAQPGSRDCQGLSGPAASPLTLMGALQYVVCSNPLLNQAVLLVDEQQALLDLAQSAYRPRFGVSAELAANRIPSSNSAAGSLGSSVTGYLGMSWVLVDFGVRDANVRQSRFQLDSARAGQQTASLNAVNEALRLFVEAATAQARMDAAQETETVAGQSLGAAQGKYEAQVASLAEKLQAQTALAQATLERVRAQGAWLTARGLLAVAMGLPVDQALVLASPASAFPDGTALGLGGTWIQDAVRQHPRVRSARADIDALKARLDSVRGDGRGSVSLSAGASTTRDLATPGSRFEHNITGSVLASVPLFNRAEQQAREAQVVAQVESRASAMLQVERDIESDLWRSVRLLDAEAENLKAADMLLSSAQQSYEITFGRYKSGVGSILELLAVQAALANARSQLAQAQLSHAQARLRLQVASGRVLITK